MIEVEISKAKYFSPGAGHVRFTCPECSNEIIFVLESSYYPTECKSCGYSKLPRMDHIMLKITRRIGWHIYHKVGYKKDILLSVSKNKLITKDLVNKDAYGQQQYDEFEDRRGYD